MGKVVDFDAIVQKAVEDYKEAITSAPLGTLLKEGLSDPDEIVKVAAKQEEHLLDAIREALQEDVPEGPEVIFQVIVGWNNRIHVQLGLPKAMNRPYGHAMDISYSDPRAVWLAIEWAHGERSHRSLNSQDTSVNTYVRLPAVATEDLERVFVRMPFLSRALGREAVIAVEVS